MTLHNSFREPTFDSIVYQSYPEATGLQSIAWIVKEVPAMGTTPTRDAVEWDPSTYGVAATILFYFSEQIQVLTSVDVKLGR